MVKVLSTLLPHTSHFIRGDNFSFAGPAYLGQENLIMAKETREERIIRERLAAQAPKGLNRTVTTKAVNPRATMTGEWKAPKGATESGMLRMAVLFFLVMVVVVVVVLVLNSPFVSQFNACNNGGDLLELAKCLSTNATPTPMP
jgi:hypothetical protein